MENVARHPFAQLALVAPLLLAGALGKERGPIQRPGPPETPPQKAQIEVVDRTGLLAAPRKDATVIQTLGAGARLVLITHDQRDGYYRVVRTDRGPVAWVASAATRVVSEDSGSRTHKGCAASLDSCSTHGCAAAEEPEGILNALKRRLPNPQIPVQLNVEDFRSLQRVADERVGQGYPGLDRPQRAKLNGLKFAGGLISEGRVVRTFGYIAKGGEGLHINGEGESVNCNLKGKSENDIHIPLVAAAGDSEFKAIVVEMIPQGRAASWTLDSLKTVQEKGYQVWVEGPLLYDKTHYVSDDADNPLSNDPNRMSLWEIHPITKFLVCRKQRCERSNEGDWEAL
jgi:hypothetical protein